MGTGGGIKQTLKVSHWNAGPGWWQSKIIEVEALLLDTSPDLLFVSEANLKANTPQEQKRNRWIQNNNSNFTEIHLGIL